MLAGGLNATATTPVDHRSDVNRSDERRSAVRSRLGSNNCGVSLEERKYVLECVAAIKKSLPVGR